MDRRSHQQQLAPSLRRGITRGCHALAALAERLFLRAATAGTQLRCQGGMGALGGGDAAQQGGIDGAQEGEIGRQW